MNANANEKNAARATTVRVLRWGRAPAKEEEIEEKLNRTLSAVCQAMFAILGEGWVLESMQTQQLDLGGEGLTLLVTAVGRRGEQRGGWRPGVN